MVVTFGSDGNGAGFRCKFCNEYSFNLVYFRSHMSVTQTGSRICSFYFTFDFIYGWGSSICIATFPAARVLYHPCWINNLCVQITFKALWVTLCIQSAFQTNSWICTVSLCHFFLSYIALNPWVCWLSEYAYGICAGYFHDFLFL